MKLLKTAGLLTVALVAAMALFGATSAMATSTQLCTSDPAGSTCPAGTAVTHEHFVDPLALLNTTGLFAVDILCEALWLGDSLGLGAPSVSHGKWTYSGPMGAGGNCVNMSGGATCGTIAQVSTSALVEVLKTGDETAEVKGTAEVLVECSGLHCVYNGVGLKGEGKGPLKTGTGTTGEVSIVNAVVNKVSGFACPTTSELTIHSKPLTALYIGT